MSMKSNLLRQSAVFLAVLVTLTINGLANALPLNGLNTGEISDRFAVYFVPARYVFSIWGLIYLGLLAFAIFQALPGQAHNPRLKAIAPLFLLSCAANSVWIFLWHYEQFPLTLIAMLVLLGSLIAIYLRLEIGRRRPQNAGERFFVQLPFRIYLGWITVATIANVTALLDYLGWDGAPLAPEAWTVIMLATAALIAAWVALTRRDSAYLLVLVWAFAGIAIKHAGVPLVSGAAWAATGLVAALALGTLLRRPQQDLLALATR
jgi:hypothetical protein